MILVREGDDAHSLAVAFCTEHALQKDLARLPKAIGCYRLSHLPQVLPLAAHIAECLGFLSKAFKRLGGR